MLTHWCPFRYNNKESNSFKRRVNVKTELKTKLLILVLGLLIVTPIVSLGCQEEVRHPPASSPSALSSTLVPNMPLDAYLYARQSSPTTIPANLIDATQNINIDSLAVWGVSAEDDFTVGIAVALTSDSEASAVYDEITLGKYGWKKLSGNTIYLVQGSGLAAESLKTVISNNDFKYYDDSESLQAVALLPSEGTTKLAAVALAKPSKALINLITKAADTQGTDLINIILRLINLKVVAGGLYSPYQIDVAEIAEVIDSGGNIYDFDLGLLVLVKSGLPGFIVKFATEKFLAQYQFTEAKLGELALYKGSWDTNNGETVHVLVRIEGNRIIAAVSGQESYVKTLITSVQVK